MRPILTAAFGLLLLSLPARGAETGLPTLLRLLPVPATGALTPGHVMLAYARTDLLAGSRGPTAAAVATRAGAVTGVMALSHLPLGGVADWPQRSGFDFDAIEAILVLETGPQPNAVQLLAGARMPGLAALAGPLAARGFAPTRIGGQEVLRRGEDNAPNMALRHPGEALGRMLGMSLRLAAPAPGLLLATRTDADMAAVLGAAGRSMADVPEMRALVATSAGGPDGRDLAQALVFANAIRSAPPLPGFTARPEEQRRAPEAELRDTDVLPGFAPWALAMLSERRGPQGIVTRIALPYVQPGGAEAAAAGMARRLAAMTTMAAPLRLGDTRAMVEPRPQDGIFVAVLEARQPAGVETTLVQALLARHYAGEPTPMTDGAVPRAALAR
jgi:hypothetical protein